MKLYKMLQSCYHCDVSSTASLCGVHQSFRVHGDACFSCNPLVVVGDLRVNPRFFFLGTFVTPAHDPEQKHTARGFAHQWTTGVTLWRSINQSLTYNPQEIWLLQYTQWESSYCSIIAPSCSKKVTVLLRETLYWYEDFSSHCKSQWSSQDSQHRACCYWCVSHNTSDSDRGSWRSASPQFSSGTGSNFPLIDEEKQQRIIDAEVHLNTGWWSWWRGYTLCLSNPYPATVHRNPAGSWVWRGGRHTTRADAVFSAQPPSLLLIFNRAEIERQTRIQRLCTNPSAALYLPRWYTTHLCRCCGCRCHNVGGLSAVPPRRSVPSSHWFHWWPSSPGVPRAGWCRCCCWANIKEKIFQFCKRADAAGEDL